MKTVLTRRGTAILVSLLVLAPLVGRAADSNLVRHQFREVDTLFANPGQGWMSQQRSPKGEPRFPCSVVYIRFNWADVEPEEGQFNWKLIDDVIAAWKPHGASVAMRVMTCNAHSSGYGSAVMRPRHTIALRSDPGTSYGATPDHFTTAAEFVTCSQRKTGFSASSSEPSRVYSLAL